MKRILTIGLMLASALALTNCTEEIVDPNAQQETVQGTETTDQPQTGIPFQVYASLGADTKTEGYFGTDENNKTLLKTKWVANDKINVFYEIVGSEGTLYSVGEFILTADNLQASMFTGSVPEGFDASKTYNWYFVYDATGATVASDNKTATVTIGSSTQTQATTVGSDTDIAHIGNTNCPMWGCAKNISGSIKPRVQMEHLASLYEITVQNATEDVDDGGKGWGAKAGDIVIYDVGMRVTTKGQWLDDPNNYQMALCGDFTLNITSGDITKTSDNNNYSVKTILSGNTYKVLTTGEKATFYFVAAPISVQSTATTESGYIHQATGEEISASEYSELDDDTKQKYKSGYVTTRQDMLDFMINGSARTRAQSSTPYVYEDATVYRYTLPVKTMQYPYMSDAFNITSQGRTTSDNGNTHLVERVVNLSGADTIDVNVNGQIVEAYSIGENADNLGSVTISGFAPDLFNAIPIGFYTSAWNNEPSVMTVNNISVLLPHYQISETTTVTDLQHETVTKPLSGGKVTRVTKDSVQVYTTTDYNTINKRGGAIMDLPLLGEREINLNISRAMLTLLGSGVESKITFSGMPQQGRYDNSADNPEHNVIVLNEDYSYKQINSGNLDQFIKNFGSRASYQGLMDIISLPDEIINSISKVSIVDVTVSTYSYGMLNFSDNKATATQNVTATYRYMNPEWPTQEINESYPQMVNTVNAIYNVLCSKSMSFLGVDVILAGPGGIIPNQYALIHILRDAKINAELGTMEEGPRLVFWGLDAKGPDVIVPAE